MAEVRALLGPLLRHLEQDACLGSVSEIFDGDAPHAPQGCVAQAWSVAELLRIYALVERPVQTAGTPGMVIDTLNGAAPSAHRAGVRRPAVTN